MPKFFWTLKHANIHGSIYYQIHFLGYDIYIYMHVLSPISVYRRSSYNTPSLFPRRQQVVLQKAYESYQRVPCWQSWYRYPLHIWRSFHEVFWTHCGHVRYHSIHILPLPHDSDSLVFITKMVFQQLVKTEFVFFGWENHHLLDLKLRAGSAILHNGQVLGYPMMISWSTHHHDLMIWWWFTTEISRNIRQL